ncbi:MAG: hypothetical protein IPK99_09830 [Flavobacteriales bacterium]|nr:hypothetical protein [Flavobacteriales bacterium]
MRKSLFHIAVLFLLCFSMPARAQEGTRLTQENGDCAGAIPIPDSLYYQPAAVRGFGNKLEIKENPVDHTQWLEREHHTTWYKFRSPVTTKLTFDIIPDSVEDDIDFLVFEGAVPGICDKIASRQVEPIQIPISRATTKRWPADAALAPMPPIRSFAPVSGPVIAVPWMCGRATFSIW